MKYAALVALLTVLGCSDDDPRFPAVEGHWGIVNGDVVCDGASTVTTSPDGPGPYTRVECVWHLVSYAGHNRCSVFVTYERQSADHAWGTPVVFATAADCSNQ